LFGEQTIVGGIKQIVIVEQGVVPGEDRRDIGVKFIFRQLGQGDKIRQRLVDGLAQALLLAGGIGGSRAERLDQGQRIAQGAPSTRSGVAGAAAGCAAGDSPKLSAASA
jgi:hypothetical protein